MARADEDSVPSTTTSVKIRTFLFADIRGYTAFTKERGADEAARLAARFTEAAHDAIEARRGTPLEIRGDQVLATFSSASQAVRAAVEMQESFVEESEDDPSLVVDVGIGLDSGRAVPGASGYHGDVLNTAARLCSVAKPGEILVTLAVATHADDIPGIDYEACGPFDLKGLGDVEPLRVLGMRPGWLPPSGVSVERSLPFELDPLIPVLACRDSELHWLRGNWRLARRGRGRVVFVCGPRGIGKTRLVSELARIVFQQGAHVAYASASARVAITPPDEPTLFVLDDLASANFDNIGSLEEIAEETSRHPLLLVCELRDEALHREEIQRLVDTFDGDGVCKLKPLDAEGIVEVAALYAGKAATELPVHSVLATTDGNPEEVHQAVSRWARERAVRRLHESGKRAEQENSELLAVESDLALSVTDLELAEGQALLLEGTATTTACPFKGLESFDTSDADYFFGRERLVGDLVARLAVTPFLGVLGPSGSGKSSVVRAGLVPALDRGVLPGSESWRRIVIRPGAHPVAQLHRALTSAGFRDLPERGVVPVALHQLDNDQRLLIIVDQFEEVFATCSEESERAAFIDELTSEPARAGSIACVVIIRADFYGRCAAYGQLAEVLARSHVLVGAMHEDELRRAIEMPARRAGLWIEPELLAAMVGDVKDQPAGLPFLSSTLLELWDERVGRSLRIDAYERIGKLQGSIARLAEGVFGRLDEFQQVIARAILVRLAGAGEGDSAVRRQAALSEFDLDVNRDVAEVLTLLTEGRLLSIGDQTVEVAHEALLSEWPRLRQWLDEDRQGRDLHRHLISAAREWETSDRDRAELYRGARLAAVIEWSTDHDVELNELERAFLAASAQLQEIERRKSTRRLRLTAAGAIVVAIVLAVAALFAFNQQGRAERETRIALSRELAAASLTTLDVDPELSILLALEAIAATRAADGTVVREAEEALHRAVKSHRVASTVPHGGYGLAVTSDGTRFATSGSEDTDNTARVWDSETGEELLVVTGPDVGRVSVAFSPNDRLLATTHNDGTVRLWDAATGDELDVLLGHEVEVTHPAFSPDGRLLAAGSVDGSTRIWDVGDGKLEMTLAGHGRGFVNPAFSPDGSLLATASQDATVRIWDLSTGKTTATLTGHEAAVPDVVFSPDGTRLATASHDGSIRLWAAKFGEHLRTIDAPVPLEAVDYSPDGTRLAAVGTDGIARVWDASTGGELLTLAGHSGGGVNLAFAPEGDRLLTAGLDDTTRVWDISATGGRDWLTVPGAKGIFTRVTFSPDGSRFAAPAEPRGVTIWDAETGDEVITLTGHDAKLTTVAFSPDGTKLAAFSDRTRAPPVWDVNTGELLVKLQGHESPGWPIAFSSDGQRLVTGSFDGTARVWDSTTGAQQDLIQVGAPVYSAAFSPDGRFVVTGDEAGDTTLWDATTLELARVLRGHEGAVEGVAFGPAGMLVTAGNDGTAKVWDLEADDPRLTFRGHNAIISGVAVSPDGTRVATASDDGTTKLWDPATGAEQLTLLGHTDIVFGVDFSPDGRLLATASPDGTVALHLLPIDEFLQLARERVTRDLTDEECRQYLHQNRCPP